MCRIDERVVRQPRELVVQRVVEEARELLGAPPQCAAQVGTAHVADEQRVAGQDRVRRVRRVRRVVDQDRDRLGRVPRRLEHGQAHRTERHRVTVGHRRERILGRGPGPQVDRRGGALAQLQVPGHEVGMEMRQEHVGDPAPKRGGVVQVLLDVALGIDHGRQAARLVCNQIRGVGQTAEVVLLENQGPARPGLSLVAARSGCRASAPPTRRRSPWPARWTPTRR